MFLLNERRNTYLVSVAVTQISGLRHFCGCTFYFLCQRALLLGTRVHTHARPPARANIHTRTYTQRCASSRSSSLSGARTSFASFRYVIDPRACCVHPRRPWRVASSPLLLLLLLLSVWSRVLRVRKVKQRPWPWHWRHTPP